MRDVIGLILNLVSPLAGLFVIFFYFFGCLLLQLDPYSQAEYLLEENGFILSIPIKFLFFFLRYTQCLLFLQAARTISLLICVPTMAAYLGLACVSAMDSSAVYFFRGENMILSSYLRNYEICLINLAIGNNFVSPAVSGTMFFGLVLSVLFNFASLKLYSRIPMTLFPLFPAVAAFILVIIDVMLPMLIDVFKNCKSLEAKWRNILGLIEDKKYLKRKLQSLRTPRVYAGTVNYNFYSCKSSTKATYFGIILNYTITSALSVTIGART
ncbi:hypothetical protein Fcan01_17203 [Folsomia candida]|uniref:Uncharacterized protein n=1 Tax=Folsomia candida TaxID=158441 RepID=A0A226DTN8_FOLCA|nr:hypothetical protein Fcan01_17203 [Folsomia candida]